VIRVLVNLEVWSRLWISVGVGRRSFRNIKTGILNTLRRGRIERRFLFTTDGFGMYEWAVKKLLAGVCIYGQVIKKQRENRVIRVDRKLLLGTKSELEEALFYSEDSGTLNTSFVERHNLPIRRGSIYLGRRTPCHAPHRRYLIGQMTLMMMYYNFVRLHMALKLGKIVQTPAMQAGIAPQRFSFRDIFASHVPFFFVLIVIVINFRTLHFRQAPLGRTFRGSGQNPTTFPWRSTGIFSSFQGIFSHGLSHRKCP
jgi:hypothetical protein